MFLTCFTIIDGRQQLPPFRRPFLGISRGSEKSDLILLKILLK